MKLFNHKKKKGFTIVELVIVIAVIAVLAAILIPTFVGLVDKANQAADTTLVRELNNALAMDREVYGEHKTMQQALEATAQNGFVVQRIKSKTNTNKILWDQDNDVFCYVTADGVQYIPESVDENKQIKTQTNFYKLWAIDSAVDSESPYSTYLYGYNGDGTVETTKGLDVGNENVTSVTYNGGTNAQDVVIRTNGGRLTVNAANDHVEHYGILDFLQIDAVKTDASYVENGYTAQGQIKVGRVVNTKGTIEVKGETKETGVENLFIETNSTGDGFGKVVIASKDGAALPTLDRGEVTIGDGVLVVEVQEYSGNSKTSDEYIWLFGNGTVEAERVVVTTETTKPANETSELNTATKSGKAGEEVANIAKKGSTPGTYLKPDGSETTNPDEAGTEAKASKTDVEKGTSLFAGGAGTENNPYLIATPEQFLKIEKGSEGNSKYYLMVNNIDFDDATYTPKKLGAQPFNAWCLISNSSSTQVKDIHFNGGGHDLSLSLNDCDVQGANRLCLFAYLGGTSVLENFNIVIDNYQTGEHCFFTLVDYSGWASEDHLTFKDITTKSNDPNVVISGTLYNNGIFTSQTYYGKVDFINCDNYVNLNGTNNKYYAPYIGGYIQSYSQVSFTDCDNYGNLSGLGSAAMFIGNNTNINNNSVTITNSYNYGTIRAASASGLFAQNSDSANAREIEELYLASCNRGIISVQSFNGFTYSIEENEINYNLTNTNNVGKIVLRINGHTSLLDNNNEYIGARGFQITQEISPVNSTNGTFTYKLGQVIRQLDYNLDIELSNSNKIYDDGEYVKVYYVEKDNQAYYVFDDGYGNYSVSPNLSIAITAYSTSGSILGNAVLEND